MSNIVTIAMLKQAITDHPNNITMNAWCYVDPILANQLGLTGLQQLDLTNPPTGVKLCIAGWLLALAGYRIIDPKPNNHFSLTRNQAKHTEAALHVLNANPIPHPPWNLLPPLFFLSTWPIHLQHAYYTAETTNDTAAMANAMCSAIDHFLCEQN